MYLGTSPCAHGNVWVIGTIHMYGGALNYLFFGVPKFGDVVNGIEDSSLVSNTCIKVVLPSTLVNTNALKYQPF